MSRDTEDKLQDLATYGVSFSKGGKRIDPRDVYISTEPEQEPVTDKPTETAMAVMPNGVRVSNVYDAYEEGRKSVMSEQEPVAWITEWVQRYRHNDTPIMDRAVSFTKGDAPAVPNPNYIPLYTAPPKREPPMTQREAYQRGYAEAKLKLKRKPITGIEISNGFKADDEATHPYSYWAGVEFAEKHHGIGEG